MLEMIALNPVKAAVGVCVCPLVVVLAWSIGPDGGFAPAAGWVINAIFAYPTFVVLSALSLLFARFVGTRSAWFAAVIMLVLAVAVSAAYNIWGFSTYTTYQLGRTTVVAGSKITSAGGRIITEYSLRDGIVFLVSFWLFLAISRRKAPR
jgi:hypothetical protein